MDTRISGTLKSWNEGKGFGFITPLNGGQDIFVHVSDYPKRGGQPKIGEPVSFEVTLNKEGKKKAIRVQRPGGEPVSPPKARARAQARQGNSLFGRLLGIALGAMIFAAGYKFLAPRFNTSAAEPATLVSTQLTAEPSGFVCDGRTHCSQMTSCAEATYFIRNCPNTQMDGDGDSEPCESQWCTSIFSK